MPIPTENAIVVSTLGLMVEYVGSEVPPEPPNDDPPVDTYPPDPDIWPDWTDPDDTDTESPDGPYSFTDPVVKRALNDPGIVSITLGTEYASGSVETVPITKQYYSQGVLSNDDLYVTFEGESFIGKLDTALFYGGRYEEGGIPASTLFAEVLSEIPFPPEGQWGYVLGDEECKTSTTRPLWLTDGYEYYHIDPALDEVMVHIPIPVVTHREALTMLASYCGAYMLHASDGSLHIRASLDEPTNYHLNLRQVYDRPEMRGGENIAQVKGKIHTYNVADTPELILGARVAAPDGAVTRFTLEHDPCADGSLTLTDATLLGTPTYCTRSVTFECLPSEDVFTVELTGKKVTIGEAAFAVDYPNTTGDVKEFVNPIASDITRTRQMYDRYYRWSTALSYTFTMRDDPALEVGDKVFLDTRSEPDGIPVLLKEINRTFNGGTEAQYTVIEDVERM